MKMDLTEMGLIVRLDSPYRCLSSAVLGGGLGRMRT
jgi:hypothetical protein